MPIINSTYISYEDLRKLDSDMYRAPWLRTNPYFAGTDSIKKVIFNPPATIVFWNDCTKTVVKCQNDDVFDAEKGLAMAIAKKHFGNKGSYCSQIKKWSEKYEEQLIERDDSFDGMIARAKKLLKTYHHIRNVNRIASAYKVLTETLYKKRPRKSELEAAMTEAIGYLGEVLDD